MQAPNAMTAAVPVVALSGYAQDKDRERCRVAGFTAHLAKPVEPADLRRFLASVGASPRSPFPPSATAPLACGVAG